MAADQEKTGPATAGWTPAGLKAWGEALIKTGTEHLDLSMVRQGRQALAGGSETPKPDAGPTKPAA